MTTKYFVSGTSYSNLPTPKSISSGPSAPGSAVVSNDTDVDINFSDGIGTAWSFSPTGMTFPDDTIQTTAYTGSTLPYKVYTALLHNGVDPFTDNPVAIVLENTLGSNITWVRSTQGTYYGENENFTDRYKVFITMTGNYSGEGNGNVLTVTGEIYNNGSGNKLWFFTGDNTGNSIDNWGSSNTPIFIEIRIYN